MRSNGDILHSPQLKERTPRPSCAWVSDWGRKEVDRGVAGSYFVLLVIASSLSFSGRKKLVRSYT